MAHPIALTLVAAMVVVLLVIEGSGAPTKPNQGHKLYSKVLKIAPNRLLQSLAQAL